MVDGERETHLVADDTVPCPSALKRSLVTFGCSQARPRQDVAHTHGLTAIRCRDSISGTAIRFLANHVELAALPADAREHAIAVPVLSRCYVDIPTDPANRTIEEEEFMTDTQEFYEAWKREHVAEGRAQGLAKGLVVIYEIRLGMMPPELKSIVEATTDEATLLAWLRLVETSPAETFSAAVLASRPG
jgi:hypothetical protein